MTKTNEIGTCTDVEKDPIIAGLSRHDFLVRPVRCEVMSHSLPVLEPETKDIVAPLTAGMTFVNKGLDSIQLR